MSYLSDMLESGQVKLDKIESDKFAEIGIKKAKEDEIKSKIKSEVIDFLVTSAGLDREFCTKYIHIYSNNSVSFVFPSEDLCPVKINIDVQTNPIQVSWKGGFKGRFSINDYNYGNELDVMLATAKNRFQGIP